MDDNKDFILETELSDEELDTVVGGALANGVRVRLPVNYGQIRYCPDCGNLINARTGTISRFRGVNSRGENVYFVKMDCCGYNYPGGCENSMIVLG